MAQRFIATVHMTYPGPLKKLWESQNDWVVFGQFKYTYIPEAEHCREYAYRTQADPYFKCCRWELKEQYKSRIEKSSTVLV